MDPANSQLVELTRLLRPLLPFVVSMVIARAGILAVMRRLASVFLPCWVRGRAWIVVRLLEWTRCIATVGGVASTCAAAYVEGFEWSVCAYNAHTRVQGLATATALLIIIFYASPLPTLFAICALVAVRDLSSTSVPLAIAAGCTALREDLVTRWLWALPLLVVMGVGDCGAYQPEYQARSHAAVLGSTLVVSYYATITLRGALQGALRSCRLTVDRLARFGYDVRGRHVA